MNMTQITKRKHELIDRVLSDGYQTTERDVAEAAELVSAYIDELERLEKTATVKPLKTDIDAIADYIIGRWYHG
jgi:hypothetical protein